MKRTIKRLSMLLFASVTVSLCIACRDATESHQLLDQVQPSPSSVPQIPRELIDRDGDGYCLQGYENYSTCPIKGIADCDDNNAELYAPITYYKDQDKDGYGSKQVSGIFCSLDPECLTSSTARCANNSNDPDDANAAKKPTDRDGDGFPAAIDCDDGDADVWQLLPYKAIDRDGDGVFVNESGQVCSGNSLPGDFLPHEVYSIDCDDANDTVNTSMTIYRDADGDGFGDPLTGQTRCVDPANLPSGYAANNLDCDDMNPHKRTMQFQIDADGDTHPAGLTIQNLCIDTTAPLPIGYCQVSATEGNPTNVCGMLDCNDSDPNGYYNQAYWPDADGDGHGDMTASSQLFCAASAPAGFSATHDDMNDRNPAITTLFYGSPSFYVYTGFRNGGDVDILIRKYHYASDQHLSGKMLVKRFQGSSVSSDACANSAVPVIKDATISGDMVFTDNTGSPSRFSYVLCVFNEINQLVEGIKVENISPRGSTSPAVHFVYLSKHYEGNMCATGQCTNNRYPDQICESDKPTEVVLPAVPARAVMYPDYNLTNDRNYPEGPYYNYEGQLVAADFKDLLKNPLLGFLYSSKRIEAVWRGTLQYQSDRTKDCNAWTSNNFNDQGSTWYTDVGYAIYPWWGQAGSSYTYESYREHCTPNQGYSPPPRSLY